MAICRLSVFGLDKDGFLKIGLYGPFFLGQDDWEL